MWCQHFTRFLLILNLIGVICPIDSAFVNLFDDNARNYRRSNDIVLQAKSAEMRNYMNASHNPCDDFYTFTCGSYDRLNPPTQSDLQKDVFQGITKSLSPKISKLLKTDELTDTAVDKNVKNFYKSCLNVGNLNKTYQAKLQEIIGEFGQMPALEGNNWQESEFDWLKTVAEISHKYNIHLILGYFIHVDTLNNTVNRMRILLQDIPLHSPLIYTDDVHAHLREARKSVIVKNLKVFLGLDALLAIETAKDIFEFESHLFAGYNTTTEENINEANTTTTTPLDETTSEEEDTEQVISNLITIEEMQNKYYPVLDIKRLVNISLGTIPTDPVYDLIGDQFEHIATVLRTTPKRIVANYIFYYLVEMFMFMPPKEVRLHQELCIKATKAHFAKVIDNMVHRKYTTNQTVQDIEYMWHTIKSSFQNVLESNKLTWMNEATRNYALEKLKNIRLEINDYQKTNFSKEFGQLVLNKEDYVENTQSILGLQALRWRSKLNDAPTSYENALMLSFSPVYIYVENLIKVPVSILQPYYFWSDSYPNALKFGTLGFLIAHELIHGFDEEGRTYDKTGNQKEWWDMASNEYFQNQTQCFSAQYHEYIYDGIRWPKLESQAENTADNGGIRLAFNAYLRWYEENVHSHEKIHKESMPHLKYNSKQLFFISYGQMWCNAIHASVRKYVAATDDHVPNKFRVIGPLSNLEEFSKEFSCPRGSGMNPESKCIIY